MRKSYQQDATTLKYNLQFGVASNLKKNGRFTIFLISVFSLNL